MKFIKLTKEQADRVNGTGVEHERILCRPVSSDLFILGLEVLNDPAHIGVREFLLTLPQGEVQLEND